jgi:serine/threonine protein kinase
MVRLLAMVNERDATVAMDNNNVGLDATMVPHEANLAAVAGRSALGRTTVLPRVDASGGHPAIVLESKDRYASESFLGEGAVGEVMRAVDNDIARPVAIKRLRAEVKSSPAMLLRFVEEIRTIGQLEHPNIVPIHDVGVDEHGDYFFVMKYVDGETLEHVIERLAAGDPAYHAKYTFEHRVRIFMGILEAIAHSHAKGIVHRDIKPANIMVGDHGQVMVMDWGLAKRIGTPDTARNAMVEMPIKNDRLHQTAVGAVIGTPAYMAPEQARGEEATESSDIYALCVLFDELITLDHYLSDCTTLDGLLDAIKTRPARLAAFKTNAHQPLPPMDLGWFVHDGLFKEPAKRYVSVQAMIDRLDMRSEGIIPIQCHITFAKRVIGTVTRFVDRHPMMATGVMALMFATSIAGTVLAVRAF